MEPRLCIYLNQLELTKACMSNLPVETSGEIGSLTNRLGRAGRVVPICSFHWWKRFSLTRLLHRKWRDYKTGEFLNYTIIEYALVQFSATAPIVQPRFQVGGGFLDPLSLGSDSIQTLRKDQVITRNVLVLWSCVSVSNDTVS